VGLAKGAGYGCTEAPLLTAVLLGLVVLMGCNDSDEDEKRASHSNGTAQTATPQKPGEKPDPMRREGEEGPLFPTAVAAEKPAPLKPTASSASYNFDSDSTGSFPENSMLPAPDRAARANGCAE